MWALTAARRVRVAVMCAALLLGISALAKAQQLTYEGDVVAVDTKAVTFTVKGSKPGEMTEMAFHVGSGSQIFIEGERRLLGELVKGDHVVVTYGTSGAKHTVQRAERIRTASREMTFAGTVIAVDGKAQTFTVKETARGKVEEMKFHVNPASRLYIGGEDVLLRQIRKGDTVTVAYESAGANPHLKHLKKSA